MGLDYEKLFGLHLITTSHNQAWKFDRPVLFLGTWCCLYDHQHIWSQMDATLAEPYGLGQTQKDADLAETNALEEKLFPEFCRALNEYHDTNPDMRFWKIVLGHWFRRAIRVLFNRIKTLQNCLNNYPITGTSIYKNSSYILAPPDSLSAIWSFDDERWNHEIYSEILIFLGGDHIQFDILAEPTSSDQNNQSQNPRLRSKSTIGYRLKLCSREIFNLLSRRFCGETDAFIISSYLDLVTVIKLQIFCGQWPQLWKSPQHRIQDKYSHLVRSTLATTFAAKSSYQLEFIIRKLLFMILPICYLEGLPSMRKAVSKLPWPKTPSFIFTSNSFDTDELFKLWTAQKVQSGTHYFVGQHGNKYGTFREMFPSIEEITSDNFITWGWKANHIDCEYLPAYIFKRLHNIQNKYDSQGGLLLIEYPLPHQTLTWDSTYEFSLYFQEQKLFVSSLSSAQRLHLTIRLHSSWKQNKWNEQAHWKSWNPSLKVETGDVRIDDLITNSRLIVHSYDSTGLLETLAANIPTLAFWQNGLEHLIDEAVPLYTLLVKAKIIHFSPLSIAEKIDEVWDDVDSWWMQEDVQAARAEFCEHYARINNNNIQLLLSILQSNINKNNRFLGGSLSWFSH